MRIPIFLILFLLSPQGITAEQLPQIIEHQSHQYQLCKKFTLRYGFIIKVADIGWYAPNCDLQKPILEAPNKIIRFHYFKDVSAQFFKTSAEKYFKLNLAHSELTELLLPTLKKFNEGYSNIKSGDYYDLVHTDNSNLSLLKNNIPVVTTHGSEFAAKYFNIWFGNQPISTKLKQAFMN